MSRSEGHTIRHSSHLLPAGHLALHGRRNFDHSTGHPGSMNQFGCFGRTGHDDRPDTPTS